MKLEYESVVAQLSDVATKANHANESASNLINCGYVSVQDLINHLNSVELMMSKLGQTKQSLAKLIQSGKPISLCGKC